jgi:hypothetical protein
VPREPRNLDCPQGSDDFAFAGSINYTSADKEPMIDTLKLSKSLQKAGMTEAQADGITEALKDSQTNYFTKLDLDLAVEKLKGELQRFILVSVIFVAIAQILVIKVWH